MIDNLGLSRKQVLGLAGLILIVIAIPLGVYLVQKTQILKSRAFSVKSLPSPILDALEIKNNQGNIINCDSYNTPPTCEISNPEITIKVKDLNALIDR